MLERSPAISIIVVSYNTRQMTLACLASVVAETEPGTYELIVIDNASSDGSADAIAHEFPAIRLVASTSNLGFAVANNHAAKLAIGEYILLLNPDTVILDDAIGKLLQFSRAQPDAQIWGGRTLFGDLSLNPASCFRRMTLWNQFCRAAGLSRTFKNSPLFNSEFYGGWKRDSIRTVDVVTGCFFLVRRSLWEKLNGFDPVFFMYGEEADLCLRARALGARPMVTPDAAIIHYGGASEKVRADKMVRLMKAKVTLIDRHWGPLERPLGRLLLRSFVMMNISAFWVLGKVSGSDQWQAAIDEWRQIWSRRREWLAGYASPVAPSVTAGGSA